MLNELYQVSQSLERVGINFPSRDSRISPMGKNRELLIVRLNDDAELSDMGVRFRSSGSQSLSVEHGSAGSSFPGFNLPTPLRDLTQVSTDLKPVLQRLSDLWKKKDSSTEQIHDAMKELAQLSCGYPFTGSQCKQFKRSVIELVQELQGTFCKAGPELTSFKRLLDVVGRAELDLERFVQNLTNALLRTAKTTDRKTLSSIQGVLFGVLDWKKRSADLGTVEYEEEKAKRDKNANQPIYLDVANMDHRFKPVAHQDTSKAIKQNSGPAIQCGRSD